MNSAWYAFARQMTKTLYYGTHGGLKSAGDENLPLEGPVILAPNHVSNLDPPAVACGTKRRRLRFMAKEELFKGFFGKLIASLGAFPVKRGEGDTEAIRKAIGYLEAGEALLIFPEGSRGDGKSLQPINRGVAMIAKRTGAPVVPVGIVGTHIVAPRGGGGKKNPMFVAYGKPFRYDEIAATAKGSDAREKFADELERRIIALCDAHGLPLRSGQATESSAGDGYSGPDIEGSRS